MEVVWMKRIHDEIAERGVEVDRQKNSDWK
jgi:hypothetical protein